MSGVVYPEHEKFNAIPRDVRERIGMVLDGSIRPDGRRLVLCEETTGGDYWPASGGYSRLIALLFNIDYQKFMDEKEQMLADIRNPMRGMNRDERAEYARENATPPTTTRLTPKEKTR